MAVLIIHQHVQQYILGLNNQYDIFMSDELLNPETALEAPFLKFSVEYEEREREREH